VYVAGPHLDDTFIDEGYLRVGDDYEWDMDRATVKPGYSDIGSNDIRPSPKPNLQAFYNILLFNDIVRNQGLLQ
jgi:hypothetical protein